VKREDEIRKAAYDILGTKGLEELHARTVAKAIGINHATVHYYFPTRDDLIIAVAEYALHQLIRDRLQFQHSARTPREKLEAEIALAEAYCRTQSRFIKVLGGLYVAGVASPKVKQKVAAIWAEWRSLVAEQVQSSGNAIAANSPYRDPDLLLSTLFGLGLASHMLDGKFNPQQRLDLVFTSMFKR
jgi:AcrR family transcriptional regulator